MREEMAQQIMVARKNHLVHQSSKVEIMDLINQIHEMKDTIEALETQQLSMRQV